MSLGGGRRMNWWRKPTATSRRSTRTWRARYPATICWRWPRRSDTKVSPSLCQGDGSGRARSSSNRQLGGTSWPIVTLRVFGPDHSVLAVVEANDIEVVRDFVLHSRLIQWNATKIHATYSIEEAIAKADDLGTI